MKEEKLKTDLRRLIELLAEHQPQWKPALWTGLKTDNGELVEKYELARECCKYLLPAVEGEAINPEKMLKVDKGIKWQTEYLENATKAFNEITGHLQKRNGDRELRDLLLEVKKSLLQASDFIENADRKKYVEIAALREDAEDVPIISFAKRTVQKRNAPALIPFRG